MILSPLSSLDAASCYVKTNGNNLLSGTSWSSAWRSVSYACSNCGAGDRVVVSNGVYYEQVTVRSNGIPGNPLIFTATNREEAVIDASGRNYGFYLNDISETAVNGFVVRNALLDGIHFSGTATNNFLVNNRIVSNGRHGIQFAGERVVRNGICSNSIAHCSSNGIVLYSADSNVIRGNDIRDNSRTGILLAFTACRNLIETNRIRNHASGGIHIAAEAADKNTVLRNTIRGTAQSWGIYIQEGDTNIIAGNRISRIPSLGISIAINSLYNLISGNTVCSNSTGLAVNGNYNIISGNRIWNTNDGTGIEFSYGDNNTVRSNSIRRFQNGIELEMISTMTNNTFMKNEICSNLWYGVYNNSFWGTHNYFISNNIHGPGQYSGYWGGNNDANRFFGNSFHHHEMYGLQIVGGSDNYYLSQNRVYSNGTYGLYLWGHTGCQVFSNECRGENQAYGIYCEGFYSGRIAGNRVLGAGMDGIFMTNSHGNQIDRNLLYGNRNNNLRFAGTGTNALVNNTILKSVFSNGMLFSDAAGGILFNNIILSNGGGAGDFGIARQSTGRVRASFNGLFGNAGGATNGGFLWGSGNLFKDPRLGSVDPYLISSPASHAVDTATNIPGISDVFQGNGPDMGYRESPYTALLLHFISATALLTNRIDLLWEDLRNETGYTLFRNTVNETNTVSRTGVTGMNVTNYADTNNLSPDTVYYYWLKAATNGITSSFSHYISAVTLPGRAQWVSGTALSSGEIFLVWKNRPNATEYELYRNTVNEAAGASLVARTGAGQTNFTDTGLSASTSYYYWLLVFNPSGSSFFSAPLMVRTSEGGNPRDTLDDVVIAPNPAAASVTFFNLTADFSFTVYSVSGGKVSRIRGRTSSGRYEWDLKNEKNERLKSGTYLLFLTNAKMQKKILKLAIIR